MKIFIIEDEEAIRTELALFLEKYGYTCNSSDNYTDIDSIVLAANPDLILLDINLPAQDGFQICRNIRKHSSVPIIMLTSRNTDFDELMSLNIGADDFVTKPFNPQVLLARISRILSRSSESTLVSILSYNKLSIDLLKATMLYADKQAELSKNELGILRILMLNEGNIISRDEIINELWQSEAFIDENTLNVNMVRLRKKLSSIGASDYIKTKRGLGYCI